MRRIAALALALVLAGTSLSPAADAFVVIVNSTVPGMSVRRADLVAVFLKKATRWGNGAAAVPVDQSGTSPVRRGFSDAVLQMPVAAIVQYWQKQMFGGTGLRPPVVKASDEETIAFVAQTAGAVGYVSPTAALPPDVKAIAVVD
jgi:ABC-type phosphate transport system substrate-binding protein